MAEELSRLSKEDIARLNRSISQANDLPARQEEIIKTILQGEQTIHAERMANLNEYFDEYTKRLNNIAKKTSKLSEEFLILEQQAAEVAASSDADKQQNKKKKAKKKESNNNTSNSNNNDGGGGGSKGDSGSSSDEPVGNTISKSARTGLNAISSYEELMERADKFAKFNKKTIQEQENQLENSVDHIKAIQTRQEERRKERLSDFANAEEKMNKSIMDLYSLRHDREIEIENRTAELRITNLQNALTAEIEAENARTDLLSQANYLEQYSGEAADTRSRTVDAEEEAKSIEEIKNRMNKWRLDQELKARAAGDGKLSKARAEEINKEYAKKLKLELENADKVTKKRAEEDRKLKAKENRSVVTAAVSQPLSQENNLLERMKTLNNIGRDETTGERSLRDSLLVAAVAVSDLAKQLESKIDEIAGKKGAIDTRLQGSNNKKFMGSYWDQLVRDMTSVGAVNPFFKQEDFAKNIEDLVGKGISFDLKQRAFLMTISKKIASTFEVSNQTLLRLVRIQQEDSTAGRLGMESALNAFLNEMYETSEYLESVAKSVKASLEEMESLMSGAEAAEVEWQVQKWLGSLYSVGMSDGATQGIADALGKIAAGQIEGLTGGGAGNLLVMAANDANISIADMLTDGINASDTNKLLEAAVKYLAELADSADGNQVVQQQLATVFGVKASDLKAATNLVKPGSIAAIAGNSMTYNNMLGRLADMAGSMYQRTSIAEMMKNFWENGQYTLAGGMASNPVSYFIYKMAKVVDDAAGGIDLPFLNVMGFGVDLNTTVSDLMRVAAVGAGLLGSIGPMISGLGSSFSGRAMLDKLDISTGSGLAVTPRGTGDNLLGSTGGGAQTTSGSGYAGNSSGSDIKDSTIQESEDSKDKQMIEAKEEEAANNVDVLNQTVIKMYELLEEVASGKSSFTVKVEGYGLTKASSSKSLAGISGVSSLAAGSSNSNSISGVSNSSSVSGNVDLGGWTMA